MIFSFFALYCIVLYRILPPCIPPFLLSSLSSLSLELIPIASYMIMMNHDDDRTHILYQTPNRSDPLLPLPLHSSATSAHYPTLPAYLISSHVCIHM